MGGVTHHDGHATPQLGLRLFLQVQPHSQSRLNEDCQKREQRRMHEPREGDKQLKLSQALLAILCVVILGATDVFAGMPSDYTEWPKEEADFVKLPPYCRARLAKNGSSAEFRAWNSSLGPDFIHIHHYCSGLHVMNHYYRTTGTHNKQKVLMKAIGQFSYMVDKANPTWSLMPEIYANRGEAYILGGNVVQGIADLNKAISLNPSLLKPYIALADHYTRHKQPQNALEIISKGLRYNPQHKGLQRRYLELGGKKPFPESHVQTVAEEKPQGERRGSAPVSQSDVISDTTPQTQPPPATEQPDTEQNTAPKIGVPGNPYCRFCPDPAPAEVPADSSVSPRAP